MRLSADPKSAHYYVTVLRNSGHDPRSVQVLVDGWPAVPCVEADTVEGWADVAVCDDAGHIAHRDGVVQTERRMGRITLAFPSKGPDE